MPDLRADSCRVCSFATHVVQGSLKRSSAQLTAKQRFQAATTGKGNTMDLEKFARVFGLEYSARPRELPPLPYFPNGIGYGAHRVPLSELPPMGGLPENMDALGGFYRHIRIGRLDESSGFCRCWTDWWNGWTTKSWQTHRRAGLSLRTAKPTSLCQTCNGSQAG